MAGTRCGKHTDRVITWTYGGVYEEDSSRGICPDRSFWTCCLRIVITDTDICVVRRARLGSALPDGVGRPHHPRWPERLLH